MKLEKFEDHLRVYITPDDYKFGKAESIKKELWKMKASNCVFFYKVHLMFEQFLEKMMYAPFTKEEYEQGELEFKKFQETLL